MLKLLFVNFFCSQNPVQNHLGDRSFLWNLAGPEPRVSSPASGKLPTGSQVVFECVGFREMVALGLLARATFS